MQTFRVDDMTCGHCVSTITRAINATDRDARVTVDLSQHLVMVEPRQADAQALRDAITEAGYTPVAVEPATVATKPTPVGGCCGCCR